MRRQSLKLPEVSNRLNWGAVRNYIGQFRLYSLVDLLLLIYWVGGDLRQQISCVFMWLAFLAFLESFHKDRGRLRMPWAVSFVLFCIGVAFYPTLTVLPFAMLSLGYSLKKIKSFEKLRGSFLKHMALVSPILNGALKATLLIPLEGAELKKLVIVFVVMMVRNLAGDMRDIKKDSEEGVLTAPVRLGFSKSIPFIYPFFLGLSSYLWWSLANLSVFWLVGVWAVQLMTYKWTPR